MLTDFDIAWAESVASRPVTEEEAIQLKTDYEDWVSMMEEAEDHKRFG
jgi:hypothetical protein